MTELVARLPRVRRRRPPSGRRLIALLWVVLMLSAVARCAVDTARGDTFSVIIGLAFAPFYVGLYLFWRKVLARIDRAEELDIPLPSVHPVEVACVVIMVLSQAVAWAGVLV